MSSLPIQSELRDYVPNLDTPWHFSKQVYSRLTPSSSGKYSKSEASPYDPEWKFILTLFTHRRPPNLGIRKITCIHNPVSSHQFEGAIANIESQANNAYFQPKWQQESQADLRAKVIKRWLKLTAPLSPFKITWANQREEQFTKAKLLFAWQGLKDTNAAESICESGFTFFGKHSYFHPDLASDEPNTDPGWFGSGIYFSPDPFYAKKYSHSGILALACTVMREPYPVVADKKYPSKPTDMEKLYGHGAYQNYNAHFIPVASVKPNQPNNLTYYPCTGDQRPEYDEVVLFSSSQTLLRYVVEVELLLVKAPSYASQLLLSKVTILLKNENVAKDQRLYKFLDDLQAKLIHLGNKPFDFELDALNHWINQFFDENNIVIDKALSSILTSAKGSAGHTPPLSSQAPKPSTSQSNTVAPSTSKTPAALPSGPFYLANILQDPNGRISYLFEIDGMLVTGHETGLVKFWNYQQLLQTTEFQNITCMQKTPDGQIVIASRSLHTGTSQSSKVEQRLYLLDPKTGKHTVCFQDPIPRSAFTPTFSPWVNAINFDSKGHILIGCTDAKARVLDINTQQILGEFQGFGNVHDILEIEPGIVAFSTGRFPKDEKIHERTAQVAIWNSVNGEHIKSLFHENIVYHIEKLHDGKIATASVDKSVRIWDIETGKCLQIFKHQGPVCRMVEIDQDLIACGVGDADRAITIWSRKTGNPVEVLRNGEFARMLIKNKQGDLIAGASDCIKIWKRS